MMDKKHNYVVGFMFSTDWKHVALILKKRPIWQEGLLNGIGGKVEENESVIKAMIREFEEETGLYTEEWTIFAECKNDHYHLTCFYTEGNLADLKTTTDEFIVIATVNELYKMNVVYNLRWLIPLALDRTILTRVSVITE